MTREYDIKNAAWDYFQDLDSHHFQILPHCNPQTDAFEAGAKWADKTMIDKACEWLRNYNTGVRGEEFINEFREAMKGE